MNLCGFLVSRPRARSVSSHHLYSVVGPLSSLSTLVLGGTIDDPFSDLEALFLMVEYMDMDLANQTPPTGSKG
jgi:hypothetical protein